MTKVLIIDDEPLARSIVVEYLQAHPDFELLGEFGDGFAGAKAIQELKPDLVFLDIQMPKINGFEMLELLDTPPSVIFTTAFDEYAIKAFETSAVDYLLKPFSKERFDAAIEKWKNTKASVSVQHVEELLETPAKQAEERNRIVVKFGGNIRILSASDIYYIEAFDDYVKIFTKDDFFLKKKTMSYFEASLDAGTFLRVHRSFIANLEHITRIEPYEKNGHIALMKNGRTVPLSRSGYARLRDVLGV